jgi:hypothetical protein
MTHVTKNVYAHEVDVEVVAHMTDELAQPVVYKGNLAAAVEYARTYFDRNYSAWAHYSSLHVTLRDGDVLASYTPKLRQP